MLYWIASDNCKKQLYSFLLYEELNTIQQLFGTMWKKKEKQVPFTGNTKMKYYDWRQRGQKYLIRL